jgi:hypothetical protein
MITQHLSARGGGPDKPTCAPAERRWRSYGARFKKRRDQTDKERLNMKTCGLCGVNRFSVRIFHDYFVFFLLPKESAAAFMERSLKRD